MQARRLLSKTMDQEEVNRWMDEKSKCEVVFEGLLIIA